MQSNVSRCSNRDRSWSWHRNRCRAWSCWPMDRDRRGHRSSTGVFVCSEAKDGSHAESDAEGLAVDPTSPKPSRSGAAKVGGFGFIFTDG